MTNIEQINREELKSRLDRGDKMKLVMAMNEWAYRHAHIPGSLNLGSVQEALANLDRDEDIILYCTGIPCPASQRVYLMLKQRGYRHVRHYAGGLMDWEAAGYPLEGEMAGVPVGATTIQ